MLAMLLTSVAAAPGCAAFRLKNPVSEAVAECRRYSCQGVTAMETGDYGQAETLLRQAAEAAPADADSRRHLAEALWVRGAREEALEHMAAAIKLQPLNPEAAVRHGEMLLAVGRHLDARSEAMRALSIDPQRWQAWALRGRAYLQAEDPDRAMADLHHALQHNPADRGVLADLADLHRRVGRRRRELTTLHQLRNTYLPGEEPTELIASEADAYLAIGRPADAVERLRVACNRTPPSATLLCQLAEAEAAAGDAGQAAATAQLALNADATHQPAQQLLARLAGTTVR